MKKLFFVLLSGFLLVQISNAQWQPDMRLTNNPSGSYTSSNNAWCIAASGSVVHVVWEDNRDGNFEIYYKRDPTGNPVGIININSEIPKEFSLSQNYPNPFNPSTKIQFSISRTPLTPLSQRGDNVRLVVFDVLGREIATLVNEQLQPGTYEVDFDGSKFSSGIYFYTIQAEGFIDTKRMILVK